MLLLKNYKNYSHCAIFFFNIPIALFLKKKKKPFNFRLELAENHNHQTEVTIKTIRRPTWSCGWRDEEQTMGPTTLVPRNDYLRRHEFPRLSSPSNSVLGFIAFPIIWNSRNYIRGEKMFSFHHCNPSSFNALLFHVFWLWLLPEVRTNLRLVLSASWPQFSKIQN